MWVSFLVFLFFSPLSCALQRVHLPTYQLQGTAAEPEPDLDLSRDKSPSSSPAPSSSSSFSLSVSISPSASPCSPSPILQDIFVDTTNCEIQVNQAPDVLLYKKEGLITGAEIELPISVSCDAEYNYVCADCHGDATEMYPVVLPLRKVQWTVGIKYKGVMGLAKTMAIFVPGMSVSKASPDLYMMIQEDETLWEYINNLAEQAFPALECGVSSGVASPRDDLPPSVSPLDRRNVSEGYTNLYPDTTPLPDGACIGFPYAKEVFHEYPIKRCLCGASDQGFLWAQPSDDLPPATTCFDELQGAQFHAEDPTGWEDAICVPAQCLFTSASGQYVVAKLALNLDYGYVDDLDTVSLKLQAEEALLEQTGKQFWTITVFGVGPFLDDNDSEHVLDGETAYMTELQLVTTGNDDLSDEELQALAADVFDAFSNGGFDLLQPPIVTIEGDQPPTPEPVPFYQKHTGIFIPLVAVGLFCLVLIIRWVFNGEHGLVSASTWNAKIGRAGINSSRSGREGSVPLVRGRSPSIV